MRENQFYKKPIFWLYIIASLIFLHSLMKIFAIVAPSYLITAIADTDNSISLSDIWKGFQYYVNEGAKSLDLSVVNTYYLFGISFITSVFFLVASIAIMFKKSWGRYLLLVLLVVIILHYGVFIILDKQLTIWGLVKNEGDLLIMYFITALFFTRKSVVQLFKNSKTVDL